MGMGFDSCPSCKEARLYHRPQPARSALCALQALDMRVTRRSAVGCLAGECCSQRELCVYAPCRMRARYAQEVPK